MSGVVLESRDGTDNREARTCRPLGVIIMCLGIAEEGYHAVAQILRDVAAISGDRFRGGAMVCGNRGAPVLGSMPAAIAVEPARSQNNTVRCLRSPSEIETNGASSAWR